MSICSTVSTDVRPLVVKPKDARRMLSCSHTRLYELIAAHELESFLDGRSRKITVVSINQYVARRLRPAKGASSATEPNSVSVPGASER